MPLSKTVMCFCAAYVFVGALCFGIYAYFSPPRDRFVVVKVRQVPTVIPAPVEIKR